MGGCRTVQDSRGGGCRIVQDSRGGVLWGVVPSRTVVGWGCRTVQKTGTLGSVEVAMVVGDLGGGRTREGL